MSITNPKPQRTMEQRVYKGGGIGITTMLPDSYLQADIFGRLHFDTCATDEEHMAAEAPPGHERRMCRVFFDKLVPPGTIGKKGKWYVTISFIPDDALEG